ncbi:hypothetical protein [Candidatus Nitrososphaera sp. FF02]
MIEVIEAIGYVAAGFAGTLAAMEAAWRMGRREMPALKARAR